MTVQGFASNIGVRQARAERIDALVGLAELVAQAVDVHVVGAGEPPELGPGDVVEAERRAPRQRAPAVAVGVDRQRGVAAEREEAGEADAGQVRHDAGAAELQHEVVAPAHLVDLAGDVEGEHELPCPSGRRTRSMTAITARARSSNGQDGAVALQLVVLDEVEPGARRARPRARPWPPASSPTEGLTMVPISGRPSTPASRRVPSTPNCGPGFGVGERLRQPQVEEAQPGELLQLEEVAGHGGDQVRQRRPHVVDRPGQGDAPLAVRRRPRGRRRAATGRRPGRDRRAPPRGRRSAP